MSNLTTRDRIEKGLDTRGLQKLLLDMDKRDENNDFVRGLIFIEARKICEEKKEVWEEYVKGFEVHGKTVTKSYANQLIKASTEHTELRKHNEQVQNRQVDLPKILIETEAELTLPKEPAVQMELRGDNAIQKARNYKEIQEGLEKEKPSGHEIRAYNKAVREAKEKSESERDEYAKSRQIPKKLKKPDPFTFEEEVDFETWCISEHGFDVVAERPKHTRAIYALKDENVSNLFNRLDEWKSAYKIMAKLCHPDTGGNTLAMSFLSDLKDLMSALGGIKEVVDYDAKIEELRQEYSSPKAKEIENNL